MKPPFRIDETITDTRADVITITKTLWVFWFPVLCYTYSRVK